MYEPQVDDYVIWKRPNGDIDEGWVYFKGEPVDNEKRVKQGWNSISQYITIETHVYEKKECRYTSGKPMIEESIIWQMDTNHKKEDTLITNEDLCYKFNR